jgi:hypothetical protein
MKTILRFVPYGSKFRVIRSNKVYIRLKQHIYCGKLKQSYDCWDIVNKKFIDINFQTQVEIIQSN